MPRTGPYHIKLTGDERRRLESVARRYTSPYRDVVRARIVLYAADGLGNDEIAARLDTPRQVVSKWRKRFFDRLARLVEHERLQREFDCLRRRLRIGGLAPGLDQPTLHARLGGAR